MGKFLALLIILAVPLGVGDVATRHYAERQLQHRIAAKVTASSVHVAISSFPFVGRLAVSGTVPTIQVRAANVSADTYTFESVVVIVHGVRIDRGALIRRQQVQLKGIDSGTATATMTEAQVDKAIAESLPGAHVKIGDGVVQATVGGNNVTAHVTVVNGQLHVTAPGQQVDVPVPQLPLLPCVAAATLVTGHLRLSCVIHDVPPALLNRAA